MIVVIVASGIAELYEKIVDPSIRFRREIRKWRENGKLQIKVCVCAIRGGPSTAGLN
jgi:hypothetical protein